MKNPVIFYELIPQGQATPVEWDLIKTINAEALKLVKFRMNSWRNEVTPAMISEIVATLDLTDVRIGFLANQVELCRLSGEMNAHVASQASTFHSEFEGKIYAGALKVALKGTKTAECVCGASIEPETDLCDVCAYPSVEVDGNLYADEYQAEINSDGYINYLNNN